MDLISGIPGPSGAYTETIFATPSPMSYKTRANPLRCRSYLNRPLEENGSPPKHLFLSRRYLIFRAKGEAR